MELEIAIYNFELLRSLQKDTRFTVYKGNQLSIDNRWLPSIRRKFWRESRYDILEPIKLTFATLNKKPDEIIGCINHIYETFQSVYPKDEFVELYELLDNIKKEMEECENFEKNYGIEIMNYNNGKYNLANWYNLSKNKNADVQLFRYAIHCYASYYKSNNCGSLAMTDAELGQWEELCNKLITCTHNQIKDNALVTRYKSKIAKELKLRAIKPINISKLQLRSNDFIALVPAHKPNWAYMNKSEKSVPKAFYSYIAPSIFDQNATEIRLGTNTSYEQTIRTVGSVKQINFQSCIDKLQNDTYEIRHNGLVGEWLIRFKIEDGEYYEIERK